jgi:hypothetical protein
MWRGYLGGGALHEPGQFVSVTQFGEILRG